ncbi:MAG: TIGR02117 family protein [Moraxella sp.]|nr:TIGR02117 family protein [Moraxella sp.]
MKNRLSSLPKPIAYPLWAVLGFMGFMLAYALLMMAAAFLPSQLSQPTTNNEPTLDIYLISNGIHTDFVLPTTTPMHDWTQTFLPTHTKNGQKDAWTPIGWGDREFYLNTPTWADLTLKTAVNALSGLSHSAIHTSYESDLTVKSCQKCRKITLTYAQYQRLIAYILHSLPNQHQPIAHAHYADNDAFYPAMGSYNLFFTCNSWVNEGLKKADIKTALWTVTDHGLLQSR